MRRTLYYTNGTKKYKGNFKNGVYSGEGKLYHVNGTIKYKGEFKNGTYEGNGKLYNITRSKKEVLVELIKNIKNNKVLLSSIISILIVVGIISTVIYYKSNSFWGDFSELIGSAIGGFATIVVILTSIGKDRKKEQKEELAQYSEKIMSKLGQIGLKIDELSNLKEEDPNFPKISNQALVHLLEMKTELQLFIRNSSNNKTIKDAQLLYEKVDKYCDYDVRKTLDLLEISKMTTIAEKLINNISSNDLKKGKLQYEGKFKDDEYNGEGILYYTSGIIEYKGEFEYGLKNGSGISYDENQNKVYEGNFKDDEYNGYGILYYTEQRKRYVGGFKNNKYSGYGIFYYKDGNKLYEGNFKDNEYNGYGILYYENGTIEYEGSFKYDLKNGLGILYDECKNILYNGRFIDYEPISNKI